MSRSEFFDVIGLFAKSQTLRVNAKIIQRGKRKEKLLLEILKRKRFFKIFLKQLFLPAFKNGIK